MALNADQTSRRDIPPERQAAFATAAQASLQGPVVVVVSTAAVKQQYLMAVAARGGDVANLRFAMLGDDDDDPAAPSTGVLN
jgi:hypothetical protein